MTIENLQIEVQATSDQAVTRLEKLEGVLERIDALGHRTGFDKLYRKLKKIASLDFSGTAKGMDGISKSVDKLTRANSRMSTFAKTVKKVREEASATNEEFSKFSKTSSPLIDTLKSITFGSLASSLSGEGGGGGSYVPPFGGNLSAPSTGGSTGGSNISGLLGDGTIFLDESQWKEKKFSQFFDSLKQKIGGAIDGLKDFNFELKSLRKNSKSAYTPLKAMKTILMYSLLFSAVSAISKGVTEGLQNVAMYSKEVNAVLTEYKTIGLQLKNFIGAGLVPVLQALYPLIRLLANALIEIANAVNALFSALNGSKTFIKAKKYVDDYAKSLGKLKGMAGMDQIHTIGQNYNYSEMFEEVSIDGASFTSALLTITELVAAVVLLKTLLNGKDWAVALTALTGKAVRFSSILKYVGAVCLIIFGVAELVKGALSAWTEGIDWGNFTEMLIGIAGVVGGIAILFGAVAAGVTLAIGGVALLVVGIKDLITNGKSLENTLTIIVGILAVGAGIAIAIGGWIPLAIAAVIAALAALAIWGDEIVAWLENFKGLFDGWITGIKDKVFGFFDNIIDKVKNFCPGLALVLDLIKNLVGALFDGVKAYIDWGITLFQDFVKIIKHLFSGDFKAVWEDLKGFFKHWWEGFANLAIVPINFLISCFEALVNFFIRGINVIINGINKISFDVPDWVPGIGGKSVGFNISQVSELKLGRISGYSTGGFPEDGLFMANHNELVGQFSNGKTAVVNNEQIIEGISRGVSDASAEQNDLLREQNKLLTQLLRQSGNGTIPVSTITKGLERQNRRNGKVIVPVGN